MPADREWLGHRDLCESQWGEPCSCTCSDNACPGVDRCIELECQAGEPCDQHGRFPCWSCLKDQPVAILRRIDDVVEDL